MKEIKKFIKSTKGKVLAVAAVLAVGFLVRGKLERLYIDIQAEKAEVTTYSDGTRVGRDLNFADNVPENNKILKAFREEFPTATVLVACEEDLTNDGLKDLVVIYNTPEEDENSSVTELVDGGHIRLTVAVDTGDGENYEFTTPIPAPVENQKIQFQNIDKKDENEIVMQGQKGTKVGYGIYRVVEGEVINLFGEGMEEC